MKCVYVLVRLSTVEQSVCFIHIFKRVYLKSGRYEAE